MGWVVWQKEPGRLLSQLYNYEGDMPRIEDFDKPDKPKKKRRKKSKPTCVACGDTGVNSKGRPCVACEKRQWSR